MRPDLASLPKGNDDNVLVQELGQPRIFSIHDLTECIAASQGHVLAQDILYSIDLRPGCDFNNISQAISTSTKAKAGLLPSELLQCLLGGMLGSLLTCDPAADQKIGITPSRTGAFMRKLPSAPPGSGRGSRAALHHSAQRVQARQMAERRESPFAVRDNRRAGHMSRKRGVHPACGARSRASESHGTGFPRDASHAPTPLPAQIAARKAAVRAPVPFWGPAIGRNRPVCRSPEESPAGKRDRAARKRVA